MMSQIETRPQLNYAPSKEGEVMSPDYGAFIQVLQKKGNNISYVSYGLPRGISDAMLDQMMTGILYPEDHFKGDVKPARFSDSDLPLLHRPGIHVGAIDRLVSVPKAVLDSEHPEQGSHSMEKYHSNYDKIVRELPGVKGKFFNSLLSGNPKAQVADGVHIFHGAYEYVNGDVIGLNLEGTQFFNLLNLPKDSGHQDQMNELVELFRNNQDVTIVLADKTKTVADCTVSCARFFEKKEGLGLEDTILDLSKLDSYQKNLIAPNLFGNEKITLCENCQKQKSECGCSTSQAKSNEAKAA